jgi:hypothetical protein
MGVGGQRHAPAALLGTHCIGGWVDPKGLDGCGEQKASRPSPRIEPWIVQPVAIRYTDLALLAPSRINSAAESTLTALTVIINKANRGVSRVRAEEDTPRASRK